ncbi:MULTISPECIES: inosine/xanthosine triphosphatase [unclassified Haladaptatus]|uniref:inosine/xanthosine triphosphatase n=1 Tax=unclassified Haladaptatus TaxID=2622732 RepID=UPI0023E7E33A|nr:MULTISPECIES: inosine/xanthosine triphosphatase [unclassified Haladaptatus]
MRVGVGSQNPVKVRATEQALANVLDATVEPVAVESGVSEQPRGLQETISGAENRARAVLDAGEFDLGIGIEGGVATVDDRLYLVMWAAVTDGERVGRGAGPSLALPEDIAARIEVGEELGPVMDDVLDMNNVAKKQGAAGALTAGIVDREAALTQAVAGALGPFVTDLY